MKYNPDKSAKAHVTLTVTTEYMILHIWGWGWGDGGTFGRINNIQNFALCVWKISNPRKIIALSFTSFWGVGNFPYMYVYNMKHNTVALATMVAGLPSFF